MKRLKKKASFKKKANTSNTITIVNLHNDRDYVIDLINDDIEEKMYEATENGQHDYDIVDIDCDINLSYKYTNIDSMLSAQEILQDSYADIDAINAYLDCYGFTNDNLQNAYDRYTDFHSYEADDDEALGYALIEVYGGIDELPEETLRRYFDYESYGRDASFNLHYYDGAYWQFD